MVGGWYCGWRLAAGSWQLLYALRFKLYAL
jgi:hypothetical protein